MRNEPYQSGACISTGLVRCFAISPVLPCLGTCLPHHHSKLGMLISIYSPKTDQRYHFEVCLRNSTATLDWIYRCDLLLCYVVSCYKFSPPNCTYSTGIAAFDHERVSRSCCQPVSSDLLISSAHLCYYLYYPHCTRRCSHLL